MSTRPEGPINNQHKRKEARDNPLKKIMCDVRRKRIGDTEARQFTECAFCFDGCAGDEIRAETALP